MEQLFVNLNIDDRLSDAIGWCSTQGIDSIGELKEAGMEADLVSHMGLKPAKAKILLKRIAEST